MTGSCGFVRPIRSYSRSGIASSVFQTVHWHLRLVASSSGPRHSGGSTVRTGWPQRSAGIVESAMLQCAQ